MQNSGRSASREYEAVIFVDGGTGPLPVYKGHSLRGHSEFRWSPHNPPKYLHFLQPNPPLVTSR